MDNVFDSDERLYRAVLPASCIEMYWKKDGSLSSAAFLDKRGLSVERGDFRKEEIIISEMRQFFKGCIASITVGQCIAVNAVVRYLPSKRSIYHSEIHGGENKVMLSSAQRKHLALQASIVYNEN